MTDARGTGLAARRARRARRRMQRPNLSSPTVLIEARLTHDELAWCYRESERGVPLLRLRLYAPRTGPTAASTVTQLKNDEG